MLTYTVDPEPRFLLSVHALCKSAIVSDQYHVITVWDAASGAVREHSSSFRKQHLYQYFMVWYLTTDTDFIAVVVVGALLAHV